MPNPSDYEDKETFMSDCISTVTDEGRDQDQAVAQCNSMWDEAHKSADTIVYPGGAVKALGRGVVGGYLVRFTSQDEPDLEGEYFDSKTNFGGATLSDVYYSHGLDATLGLRQLGTGTLETKDAGVWIQAQLELRDEYEKAVYQLAKTGKLGWSSGTAPHLVEREETEKAVHLVKWPLGLDASLTPIPADPGNRAMPLKAWAEHLKSLEVAPQEAEDASVTTTAEGVTVHVTVNNQTPVEGAKSEVKTMSEQTEKPTPREDWQDRLEKLEQLMAGKAVETVKPVDGGIGKDASEKLNQILEMLSKSGPLKDAGYVSPDSEGKEREAQKSFADWLMAVSRNNRTRLRDVYKSAPGFGKALGEQSGTAGGYLVPTEYEARLLAMAQESAVVRPRATVVPVGSNRGEIPALNQSTAPTAGKGQSAFAGGVRMYWTPEAGALTSTDPVFRMIEWNINKVGGYTAVSNELLADSAIGVESIITMLFGSAIAAVEDYSFLRGTGAGEPLGILAAPCTIAITTNTNNQFMTEDCMAMLARFWPMPGSQSQVWILHRGLIPDLYLYHTVAVAGTDAIQPTQSLPTQILGYPILYSEHMPAPNTDDAILADLSCYLIFDREGTQIAFSEHSAFTTDQGTWRVTKRFDGQPWLDAAITLADPGGATTVSPFLYHDD